MAEVSARDEAPLDVAVRFVEAVPYGAGLLESLRAEKLKVQALRPTSAYQDTWILCVVSYGELALRFGLHLLWLVVGRHVGERLVVEELIGDARLSLPTIYVAVGVLSQSTPFPRHPALHHEAQLVVYDPTFGFSRPGFWAWLLGRSLPRDDLFEQRGPVPLSHSLTPTRATLAHDLLDAMARGESLGVFGLRKSGKTSLLRATSRFMARDADTHTCWIDVQGMTLRTLHGLCLAVLDALEEHDRVGDDPLQWLDNALRARGAAGHDTRIFLDEYDLLFKSTHGRHGVEGIERFFSLLRAHAQRHHLLSLVVIGRDPSFAQQPMMEGAPNPLLGWLTARWIGPLSESDAHTLFRVMARRVCLDAGPATLDAALRWTGAHVLLLRQFGSALLQVARPHIRDDAPLPTDAFVDEAIDSFLERDAVLEMCREVEHLLADVSPEAASLFWGLVDASSADVRGAVGLTALLRAHGGWRTPAARTLRNLGLLLGTADAPWIPELWRWWSAYVTSRPSASAG